MNASQFKKEYFTNNFYWVNELNYKKLQEIAIEMGGICHTGKAEIIDWHEGFNNLGIRTRNGITKYQKEPFLLHNQDATDFNLMLSHYERLTNK